MDSDNTNNIMQITKEDLEKLLCQQLGSDLKVKNFTSKYLTKPGENYGSTILSVEVFYKKNENSQLQKLSMVGKLVPESPFLQEMFDVQITVKKEIRLYTLVKSKFDSLQKERGIPENEMIDVLPYYYGSRFNKENNINGSVDNYAILLLENLKVFGYALGDRKKGFNLKHMELTVSGLAQFHALGVALKLLKPLVFKETAMKSCEEYVLGKMGDDEVYDNWVSATVGYVKPIPECIPYLERIEKGVVKYFKDKRGSKVPPPREPFATIVHNDIWVNNVMFKYEQSDNPIKVKFVDFQLTIYASPVRDLIFLLFSSSEEGLLENHYDHLIRLYHKEFCAVLEKLGCDTGPFSYEQFLEEVNAYAPHEFGHLLFMLNPINADTTDIDMPNMILDEVLFNRAGSLYNKKAKFLVNTFVEKGWI